MSAFKEQSPYFSADARSDGVYKGKPRPFCLPRERARENLFFEIREAALAYFTRHDIKWHDGQGGDPSNHLRDGQVCCVNFLFPFADKPRALVALLRAVYPGIRRVLPMEDDGSLVSFEWIGEQNYLRERIRRGARRTRGANFTSADAAVMFEDQAGEKHISLIEWKYSESYASTSLKTARSGTDRTDIYRHLFERPDFPLDRTLLPNFDVLFYEPFYQLLREQLLAHEMERNRELGAGVVSCLHIAPAENLRLHRVTSPQLRSLGESVDEVWTRLLRQPGSFQSLSTGDVFGRFPVTDFPALAMWWAYITARYPWAATAAGLTV